MPLRILAIKGYLIASILLIMMSAAFSINQWRADSSWPIQRNFTRQGSEQLAPNKAEALRRAISIAPGNAAYHILLGKYNVYESAADAPNRDELLKEAESEYEKAIFLNPSFTDALSYLAWAAFSSGDPMDALQYLETATQYDPNNYFNHLYYGICVVKFLNEIPGYMRRLYVKRAEYAFGKGITLYPMMARHPMVFSARAELCLRRGDMPSAISELEKTGPLDRSTLPYHLKLATLYARVGNIEKSIQKYNAVLHDNTFGKKDRAYIINSMKADSKKNPRVPEFKYLLGRTFVEEGQWPDAIEALKELVSIGYWPAQTHFMLAQAYEGSGDKKSAYDEYEVTLTYQRNHPEALEKIKSLLKDTTRQ